MGSAAAAGVRAASGVANALPCVANSDVSMAAGAAAGVRKAAADGAIKLRPAGVLGMMREGSADDDDESGFCVSFTYRSFLDQH